jgi:tetratricopeptide (TPR) repeat protein
VKISLCMIVKDERDYLEGAVASAADLVDEIVVVDTGSTDGTDALAAELGARVSRVPFTGDFSAARNAALREASGEWIVFLDADERLLPGYRDALVDTLAEAPEDVLGLRLLRYNLFATGGFYTGRETRVLRNVPGLEYRRRVNESVNGAVAELGGRLLAAPVVFNHFGHCRPVAVRDAKARRYLDLMDEQLRADPDDAILLGYQGLILRTLGRFTEAARLSEQSVAAGPGNPVAWLFRGHVLRSLGHDSGALDAYQRGLEVADGANAALHNMVGVQHAVLGDHERARAGFGTSRDQEPLFLHTDINLGLLAEAEGDWVTAERHYATAGAANPAFFHDDLHGRSERDLYRPFYYETVFGYGGLGHHLGQARLRLAGDLPASGR